MIVGAMGTFSCVAVYRRRRPLPMSADLVNGWQIAVGAVALLPFAIALRHHTQTHISWNLIGALAWSILLVSIVANGLLLRMQAHDPVKAGTWLLLTPIFGYLEASLALSEPVRLVDFAGVTLVLIGLAVAGTVDLSSLRRSRTKPAVAGQ